MKTIQKISTMLALLGTLPISSLHASAAADVPGDVALTFHLFAPIPKDHTQARLAGMRAKVAEDVSNGESFNIAFMKRVREFILAEVTHAVQAVAQVNHIEVDAAQYAQAFVKNRLGAMLDENQDPNTLPQFAFTYFVSPYLIPVLLRTGLPEMTRDFNALTLIEWAHSAYLFLDYVEKGCEAIKSGMAAAGLKPANA